MTMTAEPVSIQLPPLHDSQRVIAKHPARFKVVCCGRRWGKTLLGMVLALRVALKGGRVWWVAPTYKQALEGWSYLLRLAIKVESSVKQAELLVTFATGGTIQVRTGDTPDNLRGAGLDLVVLDEAAMMKADVWDLAIRPALADRRGEALFISTPKHFNWFFALFSRGESADHPDWASWQKPTWDNPFIDEDEIDSARAEMDDDDFEQEFAASFTAIGGAVFKMLGANRPIFLRPMPPGLEFVRTGVGMDWGTTPQHKAAVVCGSRLKTGVIWYRSRWEDYEGGDAAWFTEAKRCKVDHGATFARVDRSQSSSLGKLRDMGFEAETGVANVQARIGSYGGLFNINRPAGYFDSNGPGIVEYFNHMCGYHRDDDGVIVEEEDDDVDAGGYLTCELTEPFVSPHGPRRVTLPSSSEVRQYGRLNRPQQTRTFGALGGRRG